MSKLFRTYIISHIILLFAILLQVPASAVTIEEIKPIIEQNYFQEVDDQLFNQPIDEIFNSLDQYSKYLSDEELNQFQNNINQSFVGIGIVFSMEDDGAFIQEVIANSPAENSGLKNNDIIIEVEGTSLKGKTNDGVSELILGPENTSVNLVVLRNGEKLNVVVTRKKVQIPNVTSELLAENIGYLKVQSFSDNLIELIINEKNKYKDANAWIIDLRNNGGGYLDVAQKMLGMFKNVKYTLVAQFKDKSYNLLATKQSDQFTEPVNLLVNRNSASASEIVAAALKDYEKAMLFGETTYGKGRMQTIYDVPSGGAVILTVATFLSPLGNEIDGIGVEPHLTTELPLEDAHWNHILALLTYDVFDHLINIPVEHHFKIMLNQSVDLTTFKEKIHLVTLGGELVDFKVKQIGQKRYEIIPLEPLQRGGEYAIIIHPGWESVKGIKATDGVMVRISVEK
ncbi:S41 family peptidase [Bacillaceae bacterium W0354]